FVALRQRGLVQGAAELGDLREAVEVAGLEAGVLPVVDEREQLAGDLGQLPYGHRLEAVDDAAAEHRDRRAPSLLVQPGELAEVVAARLLVRDAAAQAEAERRGHERGPDPVGGSAVAVENGAVRENA